MLMLPSQFAKQYFSSDSQPSQTTLRKWLKEGHLPGKRVGKKFYVDVSKWNSDDNPYLERILNDG